MYPREKLKKYGIENLSDMELIALIIGSGNKDKNFLKLSSQVIKKIKKVLETDKVLTIDELSSIVGIGEVTAMKIFAGIELGKRLYYPDDRGAKIMVRNSLEAYNILRYLSTKKKEYVVALLMNSRFELIRKITISVGSLNGVALEPRDIIIPALEANSASVIIAHNHPSGDSTQSDEDVIQTKRIKNGLEIVGMQLLDHLIIGRDSWSVVRMSSF